MQLYKTVDSENIIRLEEDGGAAITMRCEDGIANIVALLVPRSDRGEGIGTALLKGACKEAYERGIREIEADFYSEIKGMSELFELCGFEVKKGAPIYSIDTAALLSSDKVKKAISKNTQGVRFASLEELMMMQWDELMELFNAFSIHFSNNDLTRFSQTLSGVVYDKEGTPKSFVLCSEIEHTVNIDFLVTTTGTPAAFLVTALQGMLLEIISSGGAVKYSHITMLAINESAKKLMSAVLDEQEQTILGYSMYAHIDVTGDSDEETDITEDISDEMDEAWRRELRTVPLQYNIGTKNGWFRERERAKNKPEDKKDAQNSDDEAKAASEKKAEKISETGKEASDQDMSFPLDIADPLDIDFGFDKEIDEDYGLDSDRAKRITEDNLDEMSEILSPDAYQNVLRPFFRGIAVENEEGEASSWMVYELENMDDDTDRRAQIHWMDIGDDESGDTLLAEFAGECENDEALSSIYECPGDREDIEKVLAGAGFSIAGRESSDLIVTVGEMGKLGFAMKKTPEFVLGLGEISERQFKRGVGNCILNNRKGLLQDMAFLPMEWFEQDVSSIVLTDERVSGMLLVHQMASRQLMVDLLFSSSGDYRMDLLRLMQHSIQAAVAKYPPDTRVILRRHDKSVHGIASKIFPGKTGDKVFYSERREAK